MFGMVYVHLLVMFEYQKMMHLHRECDTPPYLSISAQIYVRIVGPCVNFDFIKWNKIKM